MHIDAEAGAQQLLDLQEHVDTECARCAKAIDGEVCENTAVIWRKQEQWSTDQTAREWHGMRREAGSLKDFGTVAMEWFIKQSARME
eukprot:scaffold2656_cov365-Pavlova_lutheri.AAC.1